MLVFTQYIDHVHEYSHTLTLAYDVRKKARIKTTLDNGDEVGIMLPRGLVLRGGNGVQSDTGIIAKVIAAEEEVSVASSDNKLLLAKAAYHLGNRHMPLQIEEHCLSYQKDHVLDDMISNLGLSVAHEMRAFEPESGAYHSHASTHSHAHEHKHEHKHEHSH